MSLMKRLFTTAAAATAATALFAGAAHAEAAFTGNVALTSDYVFRGISQSDGDPAIQGGFDYTNEVGGVPIYAGAWGSNIEFFVDGSLEVDLYGGIRPTLGPVTFDLGFIAYLYPGMDSEAQYWELKAGASVAPVENLTIGGALYWSPDFSFTNDADALYAEVNAAYTFNETFAMSGAIGNQEVDSPSYFAPGEDSYTTWNVGGTVSAWGFGFDLRYFDTDIDIAGPGGDNISDGRVVATIRRAL